MAETIPILSSFRGGMKRDFARTQMPPDSLWNIIDLLPEVLGAPARKRGGYSHASPAISGVAGTDVMRSGIWAPWSTGVGLVAFSSTSWGAHFTTGGATGISSLPAGGGAIPVFYNNQIILPDRSGLTGPVTIASTAATAGAALGGTPPAGRYVVVYKDVLWLASPSASSDRIFFSTAGNPGDTWDTTNKYMDVSMPITGMAALQNAVFVFGLSRTARVRGSIPPPDDDFIVDDPIFDVGCTDNRSIALYRDKVIWGNAQGLYISDGTALEDLTRLCGMKSWWQDVMSGVDGFATGTAYSQTAWSIATGIYGDYLFYSIMNGTTEVDSGMIDLTKYNWVRIRNLDANSFFPRPYPQELFFTRAGAAHPSVRIGSVSSLFYPASANSADADGSAVLPEFETAYGLQGATLKTAKRVFLTHDTRDPGSADPVQTISYIDSPEETSFTALERTAPETTEVTRVHRPINKPVRGLAIKVAQTNASSDTRYYGLELEIAERETFK